MTKFKKPLIYPPIILAHIITALSDYFNPKIKNKDSVDIHYSAQINGHPHMGTLTSLATAFTVGEYISKIFNKPVIIKFEALDNAPINKSTQNGKEYCKMHAHSLNNDGISLSSIYMKSFTQVMDYFSAKTNVKCEIQTYIEFQKDAFVRSKLLEIIERESEFVPYIAPSEGKFRVRFPCTKCHIMEKTAKDSIIIDASNPKDLLYSSNCPEHGDYQVRITPTNETLIDFNTSIRNVIKEAKFIEDAKLSNSMNLMIDGGDWIGMAFQVMQSLGLLGYQISNLPLRIFTPIIEDWSGAKFSKSIYVKEGTYKDIPEEFLNYTKFQDSFGLNGLDVILEESRAWVSDPKKLFRNYSVDYLKTIFKI